MKISILGAGSFGTSMAIHLSDNAKEISLWCNKKETSDEINSSHTNCKYIKSNIPIPTNVIATTDIKDSIHNANYIILAVPSVAVKDMSKKLSSLLNSEQIVVNLAKGIDSKDFSRLSNVIEKESGHKNIVVLSGPSHAEEIISNIPTTIVASSNDINLAIKVQEALSTETLRIYTNPDIIGVEIGGASKNIIALASGILDGLGYGDNAKAALMVRGMYEIIKVGEALGGKPETLNGLSGMGDLIVTCTSNHSRNKRAGLLLAQGKTLDETLNLIGMVVEGVNACECFYNLSKEINIEMPITNALYNIIHYNKDPKDEIRILFNRDKKSEF